MDNATIIHQWSQMPRSTIEAFGDTGDFARQYLLTPTILALLGSVHDLRLMDAGCGQGYLARVLARQGARVVGIEPATPLLAYAREREALDPLGITYHQADLSRLDYPPYHYDVVVANMGSWPLSVKGSHAGASPMWYTIRSAHRFLDAPDGRTGRPPCRSVYPPFSDHARYAPLGNPSGGGGGDQRDHDHHHSYGGMS